MHRRLQCAELWGGVHGEDMDVSSATVDASLFSLPADGATGGDVYYFSVCTSDLLTRVAVADVVGHGQAVSAVSEWLLDALRQRMNSTDGGGVLLDLNKLAADRGLAAMTTAAVAAFYRADSNFYFAYAGHHEMLLLRAGGSQWEAVAPPPVPDDRMANLPLGVLADTEYDQSNFRLSAGDRLALYTDGVIEAPGPGGELFGLDRLLAVLDANARRSLPEIKAAVLAAVRAHTGGTLAHDDVTLLVAEMK